ncbi:M15 family metallopeptidase [Geodermatophilus nigrescens]
MPAPLLRRARPLAAVVLVLTAGCGVAGPTPSLRHGGSPPAPPGGVTVDDGVLPDGAGVFDDRYPAVSRLDAELLAALRAAASAASRDGVEFVVTSGWRSPEYQEQLLREAVDEYGSLEEAARWVATAETSAHVTGDAVDVGPTDAMSWLSQHGADFGLCQVYGNEPWHQELRPAAVEDGCPAPYADPTEDPRMQP